MITPPNEQSRGRRPQLEQPTDQKRFGQRTPRRNNKYEKTCRRPNRLNLLNWTPIVARRSNFLRKSRKVGLVHQRPPFCGVSSSGIRRRKGNWVNCPTFESTS